jgi:SAM-dependent methyltransferase
MNALPVRRVNLGCGSRLHPEWLNYDLTPVLPGVIKANFIAGIPLPDNSTECVYHSHVLEHLPRPVARQFLLECKRVLVPGGILRIVVPDLEQIARDYVRILDRRRGGEDVSEEHRWMIIEMVDQMVRTRPGGELGQMTGEPLKNPGFIAPRLGAFGKEMLKPRPINANVKPSRFVHVQELIERWFPRKWGYLVSEMLFRKLGEVHRWMYDELSLGDLMREVGFVDVARMQYDTSRIPEWHRFVLDSNLDGTQYKGISLYMEARKGDAK